MSIMGWGGGEIDTLIRCGLAIKIFVNLLQIHILSIWEGGVMGGKGINVDLGQINNQHSPFVDHRGD